MDRGRTEALTDRKRYIQTNAAKYGRIQEQECSRLQKNAPFREDNTGRSAGQTILPFLLFLQFS